MIPVKPKLKVDVPVIYDDTTAPWRDFRANLLSNFDEFTVSRSKDFRKIVVLPKNWQNYRKICR